MEEQRIERHPVQLGHAPRRGMGEFVGLADDEIVEAIARIERCAEIIGRMRSVVHAMGRATRTRLAPLRGGANGRLGARQRRLHDNLDAGDGGVFPDPQGLQTLAIVGDHPVLEEAGRHRDSHAPPSNVGQRHRLQPAFESRIAEFLTQPASHPSPLGARRIFAHDSTSIARSSPDAAPARAEPSPGSTRPTAKSPPATSSMRTDSVHCTNDIALSPLRCAAQLPHAEHRSLSPRISSSNGFKLLRLRPAFATQLLQPSRRQETETSLSPRSNILRGNE